MDKRITVLKFGGSVLGTEKDLPRAVSEAYRWVRQNHKVIVVASAYYGTTDRLESRAKAWGIEGNPHAAAEFIATGEQTSCSELTMALARAGIAAHYVAPRVANLLSVGPVLDSDPISLKCDLLERLLETNEVLVVPGFVACDSMGATNLLGRGGSDLTALFIAYRMRAQHCRLLKDTDGLYEWDPKRPGPKPNCFAEVTWEQAMALEKRVLQPKALRFAQEQNMAFSFACLSNEVFTKVGASRTSFRETAVEPKPLRVTLLGLGTVGRGVYDRLTELPDRFQVVACVARTPDKHRGIAAPLFSDPLEALEEESDVVVELIGGVHPANEVVTSALKMGRQVVTANKDLIASHGPDLELLGGELRYSAAVGGAVPMIERTQFVSQSTGVQALRGVVNGTCNYIIDRVLAGEGYDAVLQDAIEIGFAEADPLTDIGGIDAAYKLVILVREAFGLPCSLEDLETEGIQGVDWTEARSKLGQGQRLRLVAFAERTPTGFRASVSPQFLPETDPLAEARGPGNALVLTDVSGHTEIVRGLGAGRYPTTEAVMADLLDLSRLSQSRPATALVST